MLSGQTNVRDLLTDRGAYNAFGLRRPLVLGSRRATLMLDGKLLHDPEQTFVLDLLPVAGVERIEILAGSGSGLYPGGAVSGAINIVLRSDFEGLELQGGIGLPDAPGADSQHGAAIWGGAAGRGHLVIGADAISKDEIRSADREHSRASWTPGGSFRETTGVSEFANTVVVGGIAKPLGDCDGDGYTGILQDPLLFRDGSACGFASGDRGWTDEPLARETLFADFDHPVGESAELYASARIGQLDEVFSVAPAAGVLSFRPTAALRSKLLADPDIDTVPDSVTGYLRFLGHGKLQVWSEAKEDDLVLGVRGRSEGGLGWDAYAHANRYRLAQGGGTVVHRGQITTEIEAGNYDLANPLSDDPAHLEAIRNSSLEADVDLLYEHLTAGLTIDGDAFALGGGQARWAVGTEMESMEHADTVTFFNVDDPSVLYTFEDAIGGGGYSYQGERRYVAAFGELLLPATPEWTVSAAVRHDDYDDVGGAFSHQISSAYVLGSAVTVQGSWARSSQPPILSDLNASLIKGTARVCDTRNHQGPLEDCSRIPVEAWSGGNPSLKPDNGESVSLGAMSSAGPLTWNVGWFRTRLSDVPAALPAQQIVDLEAQGQPLPAGASVRRADGQITRIDYPQVNVGEETISGIDIQVGASWDAGWAGISADLAWLHVTDREVRVGGELQPDSYPSDRVHGSLRVSAHGVTLGWDAHAISGYEYVTGSGSFGKLPGWVGHDLSLHWPDPFGLEGMYLAGGILNVGDRGPSATSSYPRFVSRTIDAVRGRTFFLRAGRSW